MVCSWEVIDDIVRELKKVERRKVLNRELKVLDRGGFTRSPRRNLRYKIFRLEC